MKLYLSTEPTENQSVWDTLVATSPWGHLLQSSGWADFKSGFGWRAFRLLAEDADRIVAGAQVLVRPTAAGPVAYVPRGPVMAPDDAALPAFLEALSTAARQQGAVFLKLEPGWPEAATTIQRLQAAGFQPGRQTIQPRATILLDLRPTEDELLKRMKSKWRYNIRLAGRKGVQVRVGSLDDLPAFYALLQVTSRRDRFPIHPLAYYQAAWEQFHTRGQAELLLAYFEQELLAGLMVFRFGETAYYLYGASSNRERNRMPNHLLQWEAIRWARRQGCTCYDFWGIPDAVASPEEPKDPLAGKETAGMWGVYRFKQGFGGQVVRTIGTFDRVFKPARYWLGTRVWPLLRAVRR